MQILKRAAAGSADSAMSVIPVAQSYLAILMLVQSQSSTALVAQKLPRIAQHGDRAQWFVIA